MTFDGLKTSFDDLDPIFQSALEYEYQRISLFANIVSHEYLKLGLSKGRIKDDKDLSKIQPVNFPFVGDRTTSNDDVIKGELYQLAAVFRQLEKNTYDGLSHEDFHYYLWIELMKGESIALPSRENLDIEIDNGTKGNLIKRMYWFYREIFKPYFNSKKPVFKFNYAKGVLIDKVIKDVRGMLKKELNIERLLNQTPNNIIREGLGNYKPREKLSDEIKCLQDSATPKVKIFENYMDFLRKTFPTEPCPPNQSTAICAREEFNKFLDPLLDAREEYFRALSLDKKDIAEIKIKVDKKTWQEYVERVFIDFMEGE